MTIIGFIRHGRTSWNEEGREQGKCDIALNEVGVRGAHQLAKRITSETWDVVYSSPLVRARQTAEIIGEYTGLPIYLDSRISEVGSGLIEGTTEEERVRKWGTNWRELDLGIESNNKVLTRGLAFIKEVCDINRKKNILVVSHGSFIEQILEVLTPHYKITEPLNNTSITTLKKNKNEWDCILYNCTKHLKTT
ncbi:histidine phosphatase family protein [Litchfieldia salsa]|nr:histidine phosphatase family protein [Litchfieldia salsa]